MAVDGSPARPGMAARRRVETLVEWLRHRTAWQWSLLGVLVAYSVVMTRMSLDAHHGLGTGAYDLGIYEQGIWLLSRFESPFITLRGVHLFGEHTSFILVLLAPLYWVFPTTGALLGAQSVAIAAGALPVFLYARHRLGGEGIAFLIAVVYLLHPAVSWKNMEEFHPEAFYPLLVGFAIYSAVKGRWRPYWVCVALTLLIKEDTALVIVPLGLWVAFRGERSIGIYTMVAGAAYTLIALFVVIPYFSGGNMTFHGNRLPFGGPMGLLDTAVTDPGAVVGYLLSGQRPWYLLQLTAPFAWVFLRRPGIAAIGSLVVLVNLLSTQVPYQHSVRYHYSLVLATILAMGTVYALGAVERRRRIWVAAAVGGAAMLSAFLWSTLPMARDARVYDPPSHPRAVAARETLALIPDDAVVSAEHDLAAHLARRRHVYFRPNPFYASNYGTVDVPPEGTRLPISDAVQFVIVGLEPSSWQRPEHVAAWEREKGSFERIFSNGWYEVYRRVGSASR